jgi:hypothetical protein
MPELHEIATRESDGRRTIDRYRLQFLAAAYASLQILDGKEIDRVFCDFQDDFVVRRHKAGQRSYHFYQVKTKEKRNYQWTLAESFGLNKKVFKAPAKIDLEKVRDSFFGKLLQHAINFGPACNESALLTNVHFKDDVETLVAALHNGDENPNSKFLIEKFQQIFEQTPVIPAEVVIEHLKKLNIYPNTTYIAPGNNDFAGVAREAIYKYSEIDLSHEEIAEIAQNLVTLVLNKSFKKIMRDVSESELDEQAGIGIDDLLAVLSISKVAYMTLLKSGDEKALKSASIIQRRLREAGAEENMIEYCTRQKVAWDVWIRDKRHSADELEFNLLQQNVAQLAKSWNGSNWDWLKSELALLIIKLKKTPLGDSVNQDLLFGGVFATLIRSGSL